MYELAYRQIAAEEYEEAINWYAERSTLAAERFVNAVNERLDCIGRDPKQYRNVYKNFFEINSRKYPYSIVYLIEERK